MLAYQMVTSLLSICYPAWKSGRIILKEPTHPFTVPVRISGRTKIPGKILTCPPGGDWGMGGRKAGADEAAGTSDMPGLWNVHSYTNKGMSMVRMRTVWMSSLLLSLSHTHTHCTYLSQEERKSHRWPWQMSIYAAAIRFQMLHSSCSSKS